MDTKARNTENGVALASTIIIMALMGVITLTVLAVVASESRMSGSDLQRTQTFYCAEAGIEKMTTDFSALFGHTARPTTAQLSNIADDYPPELLAEGFVFSNPSLAVDNSIPANTRVTIPTGPFAGLVAGVSPYTMSETCTQAATGTQVALQRQINNYLIPIFQFGMFSDRDLEIHPGPPFWFNGRVHANGNIYLSGNVTLLSKVTTANEIVRDVLRNGNTKSGSTVSMTVGSINVSMTKGSVNNGPNVAGQAVNARGYNPGSPTGTFNTSWDSTSVAAAAAGVPNQFGGQLQTRSTGAVPLLLPLQLDGNPSREIIKRRTPNDSTVLSESRYHTKASIRILIDDEGSTGSDASGIGTTQGVPLSTWTPTPLGTDGRALWRITNAGAYDETTSGSKSYPLQLQNGTPVQADTVRGAKAGPIKTITNAVRNSSSKVTFTSPSHGYANGDTVVISGLGGINVSGSYSITFINADNFSIAGSGFAGTWTANTGAVYSFAAIPKSSNGTAIPGGAGITGRILIQIVDSNGATYDVTQQILSMGITEGEPNSIIQLQRPLWAAFLQGSRDSSGAALNSAITYPPPSAGATPIQYANSLTDIVSKTTIGADGEIAPSPTLTANGFLTGVVDDAINQPTRQDQPPAATNSSGNLMTEWGAASWASNKDWNTIVPINVYNIREGRINGALTPDAVYERGITSIVELNMKNLARWVDGVYDTNLLSGTNAVSTNIATPDGYTVYVSDRRGDRVRSMVDTSGATINSTNGMVDNEDIYGPNSSLDPGEDVQNKGTLVRDTNELPDPATLPTSGAGYVNYGTDANKRAIAVAAWSNQSNYFRRAVRLFNGENLQVTGGTGKLSTTKGITVATENMAYIWGNYNTTGITCQPSNASTLNDPSLTCRYLGNDVPTSVASDAFFPLSKTWFDALSAIYPGSLGSRPADQSLPGTASPNGDTWETSVRTAIIAGNNMSALAAGTGGADAGNSASGESRLNGGMHNFPRFLEDWRSQRWNFVGSLIPLYHATQAVGQYNADSGIYSPPTRNWAFDSMFQDPDKLPPGTPQFQYIEPTSFKQILQ